MRGLPRHGPWSIDHEATRRGGSRLEDGGGVLSATMGSFPFREACGGDHDTGSSSSESEDGMLKQSPSGDLEVPAAVEGVKGVAEGLSALDPPAGELGVLGLSSGGVSSRRGGRGGSLILRGPVGERGCGGRWPPGPERSPAGTGGLPSLERETREREHSSFPIH